MERAEITRHSKFLSFVLRHHPESIGLTLDDQGWASTDELLARAAEHGRSFTFQELKEIVDTNEKKRFAFSSDLKKIRASQGHSITVDLQLKEQTPPARLYHGTVERNLESIRKNGLIKGQRQYVHLSLDRETSRKVGMRHGKPVVLTINAEQMNADGFKFFVSENGVWLTDSVSPHYLLFDN